MATILCLGCLTLQKSGDQNARLRTDMLALEPWQRLQPVTQPHPLTDAHGKQLVGWHAL